MSRMGEILKLLRPDQMVASAQKTISHTPRLKKNPKNKGSSGFTLIEIIIVISIVAVAYAVAMPQFNLVTGTSVAEKLGTLSGDIRSAYDMAVLRGKPHRLVFVLATGQYWLEQADRREVYIGSEKLLNDPTDDDLKLELEEFEEQFEEYIDQAGAESKDPETGEEIKPTSPVVVAKDRLKPPKWSRVENLEWKSRTIGPDLIFKAFQAEHHEQPQTFEVLGVEARAFLYFFPTGYVEKAFMHIGYTSGDMKIDDNKKGYTLQTKPYEGVADVSTGYEEVDLRADDEV